jgi:hypothetical protein
MWRFDLEKQLFWSRFDHTQKIIRPGNPYRPTWSWASLAGVVGFYISPSIFNFRVVGARVTLATADEYGEVASGSLQLECHPLIRATLTGQQSLSIGGVALSFFELSVSLDDEPVPLPYPDIFAMHGAYDTWWGSSRITAPPNTGKTTRTAELVFTRSSVKSSKKKGEIREAPSI